MTHKKTDEGYPIFRSYLETENDEPYYSMNTLSFYYEDMARKQKLIEDLAKAIAGYDQTLTGNLQAIEEQVAERFEQWDEKLKTFDGSVMDLLQEWVDDGTMDHIVDSSIVDRKLAPLATQMADKVGGQRKLKPEEFSDEAMALVTGNGTVNVLSIPQDKSVTPEKTTFIMEGNDGENLFATQVVRTGGYYDESGEFIASAAFFSIGGFLPIQQNVKYNFNTYNVRMYDANDNVVGSLANLTTSHTFTDGVTVKIRPNFRNTITPTVEDAFIYKTGIEAKELIVSESNLNKELKDKINEAQSGGSGGILPTEKFMHISCDDFLTPLQDLYTKRDVYNSIFENVAFKFLKETHDKYGMTYSAYCWYENADASFNLSMVPDKFKAEFIANSDWLKFGFHSKNLNTNLATANAATALADYTQIINEILRFTGSYKCIDRMPRLHNYAGSVEAMEAIRNTKAGIVGLLTAEDTRASYYHTTAQNTIMQSKDRYYDSETNLFFYGTDMRLDSANTPKATLEARRTDPAYEGRMNDLVMFQHDPNVNTIGHQLRVIECCEFAIENGYRFDFPMNIVMGASKA